MLLSALIFLIVDLKNSPDTEVELIENKIALENDLSKISRYENRNKDNINVNHQDNNLKKEEFNIKDAITLAKQSIEQKNMSHKNLIEIKANIKLHRDFYNDEITKEYFIALENNNINDQITVINTASFYSLSSNKLLNETEKVIYETATGEINLNHTLLKAALNYYLNQSTKENIENKKNDIISQCKNEQIRTIIKNELKNFNPSQEIQYESN